MKILFSHATGNQNVRAALDGLESQGILGHFSATIALFGENRIGNSRLFSEINRRSYNPSLKGITSNHPFKEAGRLFCTKFNFRKFIEHENGILSIDAVIKDLDKSVARNLNHFKQQGITSVYSYEDGAIETFTEAKKLGLDCFYDLPIGYWRAARKLLEIEKEKWPDWVSTLSGFSDSANKLEAKDNEIALADKIFVASSFTAETLSEYPGKLPLVKVIPYGFPNIFAEKNYENGVKKKLKILFVGGLSQRKGLANLFAAVKKVKEHVELTIVGQINSISCKPLEAELVKYNWIPSLPHADILKLMQVNDVFIFPSLFEGFGLVITEAMSQGLPVITTNRTAGPDLITNNKNGWIIEAGSTVAIVEAIENILFNREHLKEIGKSAMETARLRPWSKYGEELARFLMTKNNTNFNNER